MKTSPFFIALVGSIVALGSTGLVLFSEFIFGDQLAERSFDTIPSGAVIAFDSRSGCPEGWVTFAEGAGRTIIGVGAGDGLTQRRYRETDGEEFHRLSPEEMPAHEHSIKNRSISLLGVGPNNMAVPIGSAVGDLVTENATGIVGESQPHNNMQPFIALFYCVKT